MDAARGAWLAVALEDGRFAGATLAPTIDDRAAHSDDRLFEVHPVLAMHSEADAVAIDIPLGIIETYGRKADTAARRFVQPRGSSVFPTPPRAVIEATDYDAARAICDERGWPVRHLREME